MSKDKKRLNSKRVLGKVGLSFLFGILIFQFYVITVDAWGNGGFSDNPLYPKYGTHDWIAEHALDWLPAEEKKYIKNNLDAFLLGTEMPDNSELVGGLGDTALHIVLYYANQSLQNDAAASRASSEFDRAINYINYGENKLAAQCAGKLTHYIADLAMFGHVMDSKSDWKDEIHHSDFEDEVGDITASYTSVFDSILVYDGSLVEIDAYDAALQLAYTTTFGDGGNIKNCTWMDKNYSPWVDETQSWGNPSFYSSAAASINLAVNLLTDVLHTVSVRAAPNSGVRANHIVISEIYYDASGDELLEEYIELYNPTSTRVDLSHWRIETASETYTIPAGSTIRENSYFTLARNEDNFLASYGKAPDVGELSVQLPNSKGQITLKNSDGEPIDFVAWNKPISGWDIKASAGKTIQRIPADVDTDTDNEWMSNSLQTPMVQSDVPPSPPDMTTAAIAGTAGVAATAGLYVYYRKKSLVRTYHCPTCNVPIFSVRADLPVPAKRKEIVCPNGHKVKVPAFSE